MKFGLGLDLGISSRLSPEQLYVLNGGESVTTASYLLSSFPCTYQIENDSAVYLHTRAFNSIQRNIVYNSNDINTDADEVQSSLTLLNLPLVNSVQIVDQYNTLTDVVIDNLSSLRYLDFIYTSSNVLLNNISEVYEMTWYNSSGTLSTAGTTTGPIILPINFTTSGPFPNIVDYSSLQAINVYGTDLGIFALPDNLLNLESINAQSSGITYIPNLICPKLTRLFLSSNPLTSPPALASVDLENFTSLDLTSCQLTDVPDISMLQFLQSGIYISLVDNNITSEQFDSFFESLYNILQDRSPGSVVGTIAVFGGNNGVILQSTQDDYITPLTILGLTILTNAP